jgi:hypothetical protein
MAESGVRHRVAAFNWALFIIPMFVIITVHILNVALKNRPDRHLRVLSDCIDQYWEYRTFSTGMTFYVLLFLFVLVIRDNVYILTARTLAKQDSWPFLVMRIIVLGFGILMALGTFLFAICPPGTQKELNAMGVHCFMFGGFGYGIANDLMNAMVWKPAAIWSRLLTWVAMPFGIILLLIRFWLNFSRIKDHNVSALAAVGEIIAFVMLELKVARIGWDMPASMIRMSNRQTYV